MTLVPVSLGETVKEALEAMGPEIAESRARVVVEPTLPAVVAHPTTLAQVVLNLLRNALKFVPAGEAARVKVYANPQGGWVRLYVEGQRHRHRSPAPGADLPALRAPARGGALSRHRDRPQHRAAGGGADGGQGGCDLGRWRGQPLLDRVARRTAGSGNEALSAETILLVEDNPDDVLLIKRAFNKAGFKHSLQVATHGEEAVEYLAGVDAFADREKHPFPALVLLDLQLPRRSGHEILAWLRAQEELRTACPWWSSPPPGSPATSTAPTSSGPTATS